VVVVATFVALAACHTEPPPVAKAAVTLGFRAGSDGPARPRDTASAIELANERDARSVEVTDPEYVGELDVESWLVKPYDLGIEAAKYGATHYRIQVAPFDPHRVPVVLLRVAKRDWRSLPDELRPIPLVDVPAGDERTVKVEPHGVGASLSRSHSNR
jgi:hypothetical protein